MNVRTMQETCKRYAQAGKRSEVCKFITEIW